MKDVYAVLQRKEHDLAQVRKEVHALLTVIPLLADEEEPSSNHIYQLLLAARPTPAHDNGMADLERYYPFVRNLQTSDAR